MTTPNSTVEAVEVTQADWDLEGWFLRRMGNHWKGMIAPMLARHRIAAMPADHEKIIGELDALYSRMNTGSNWVLESGQAGAQFSCNEGVLAFSDDCEYHPVADFSRPTSCETTTGQAATAAFVVAMVNAWPEIRQTLTRAGQIGGGK